MLANAPTRDPDPAVPTEHAVRFYEKDQQLLDEVGEFLDAALRAGGRAVVIATAAHRTELARRLGGTDHGAAADTGWPAGRLLLLDAAETLDRFMVDGQPDRDRFESALTPILASPGEPLHAFGEMVALLCEAGNYEGALALELLWNALVRRHRFSLFCGYPWRLFSSNEHALAFQHVCAAHGRVLEGSDRAAAGTILEPGRTLVQLQQQALVLQTEVERRREAERTLLQRERELADFLDNASEGIHKVAGDGTILYANRAELDLLGYRWEEYVGRSITDFYVEPRQIDSILKRLKRGEVLRDEPGLLRCKDGSHRPVLVCSNGFFENGELVYTRCFTRDASERVAHDREREQLLASLREASRAKDEFLAMLGHELRNPLSPIVTALQLMRIRGETGTSREQAIIQRQVDHLVRLVDDLLDISRITRGKIELKREPCELATVLTKAVEQASILLEQRSHQLRIESEAGLQCECDPVRLAQVVANLLTNAARYTEPGGDIRLRARRESDGRIAISVRDNGHGIAAERLARIFELFYQGERGVDRAEGGLGIGLAIVRSLVELHGGTVEARSEGLGRGSEFLVWLPAVTQRSADAPPASQAVATEPVAVGRRILLVDDNVDAVEVLGELLRVSGHAVAVFTDPASALLALPQLRPDLAVLDIGLPVMDGYELAAKVRKACGDSCRLVALTGYGQENDKARAHAAGFHAHLVKPVSYDRLAAVIRSLD